MKLFYHTTGFILHTIIKRSQGPLFRGSTSESEREKVFFNEFLELCNNLATVEGSIKFIVIREAWLPSCPSQRLMFKT